VSFSNPVLLLLLLVVPAALAGWWLVQRRRMRYAVRFTNVDLLATLAPPRSWRRHVAPALFLLALAGLCVAVARPHVTRDVGSDRAAVILVLDVSGSMQAQDVKPTRLAAAQKALHAFLDKVPKRVRVGLVLFAAEAEVATPPTADHALVAQAVDDAGMMEGFGGTAIGDALQTAVQLGQEITGSNQKTAAPATRGLAALRVAAAPSSTLVSILFLSDGHQTRGILQPLEGAALAKQAGFPVYTVALGTTGNTTLRGGGGLFGGGGGGGFFGGGGLGNRGLSPDPATLRAIANLTGGTFYRAKTAGAVEAAYSKLGSSLGRTPGRVEITDEFVTAAAVLLVLAGLVSALWAPRLP
jgi:Ca-activated chloride channel family protein